MHLGAHIACEDHRRRRVALANGGRARRRHRSRSDPHDAWPVRVTHRGLCRRRHGPTLGREVHVYESLRDYVTQGVLPAYRAFLDARDKGSFGENRARRAAVECAKIVYHLREQFTPKKSRASLTTLCADFGLLADICNAVKHGSITQGPPPLVTNAHQLFEQVSTCTFTDEAGEYQHAELNVLVTQDDGTIRDVAEVLKNVLSMFGEVLKAEGVFTAFVPPTSERLAMPRVPRDRARSMNLAILQAENRKLRWQFMEYEAASDSRKPVDLTGAVVRFRVFEPPKTASVRVHVETPEGAAVDVDFEVPLTKEQALQFMELDADGQAALAQSVAMGDPMIRENLQAAANAALASLRAR